MSSTGSSRPVTPADSYILVRDLVATRSALLQKYNDAVTLSSDFLAEICEKRLRLLQIGEEIKSISGCLHDASDSYTSKVAVGVPAVFTVSCLFNFRTECLPLCMAEKIVHFFILEAFHFLDEPGLALLDVNDAFKEPWFTIQAFVQTVPLYNVSVRTHVTTTCDFVAVEVTLPGQYAAAYQRNLFARLPTGVYNSSDIKKFLRCIDDGQVPPLDRPDFSTKATQSD